MPAELCIKKDKRYLTKDSLVITVSASGDTKEILAAVKMCKEMGIEVAGFTKNNETPLAKELDYIIANPCGDCEDSYMMFFMLGLRLLYNRGEFPNYEKFADQMGVLHENLLRIREEFEPRAAEIARAYAKEPYNIFVGSGTLWGETYLFSHVYPGGNAVGREQNPLLLLTFSMEHWNWLIKMYLYSCLKEKTNIANWTTV